MMRKYEVQIKSGIVILAFLLFAYAFKNNGTAGGAVKAKPAIGLERNR